MDLIASSVSEPLLAPRRALYDEYCELGHLKNPETVMEFENIMDRQHSRIHLYVVGSSGMILRQP